MKEPNQGRLIFAIVGSGKSARERFSDEVFSVAKKISTLHSIYEKILFKLFNGPLSLENLAETRALTKPKVKAALKELQDAKFVKNLNGKYGSTLPVFTDELMRDTSLKTERIAFEMSKMVEKHVDKLIFEWERTRSPLKWNLVAHMLVDAFALDFMFLRAIKGLEKKNGVWENRSKGQRLVPALFLERGEHFTNFGVNTYTEPKLLELHGTLFEREQGLTEILSDEDAKSVLARAKSSGQVVQGKLEVTHFLLRYNWVQKEDEAYRLSIPFVHLKEIQRMLPSLAELSVSAAETAFEHYAFILQMFQGTPFASYLDGPGDYIDYVYHILMYQTIEQLIKRGKLPDIPKPAPWNIGVFLLGGNDSQMLQTVIKMNEAVDKIVGVKTGWVTY